MVGRGQYRRKKVTKFVCDFCGQSFKDRTRWIRHRWAFKDQFFEISKIGKYNLTLCTNKILFRITHKGMKFQCSQEMCLKKFSSRNKLKLHQKTTGHEGEGKCFF